MERGMRPPFARVEVESDVFVLRRDEWRSLALYREHAGAHGTAVAVETRLIR
jgi:hypothetical protein